MTDRYTDYDPISGVYNRHWGFFAAGVLPVLDRLIGDSLVPGARVLDVCCGTGQLAALLTERGMQVVGIDGSAAQIERAQQNAPQAEFTVADARTFAVPPMFNAAVSTFDSLNHVMELGELRQVFANVHRALLPGGRFVFDLNMDEGFRARWHGTYAIVEDDEVVVAEASYDPDQRLGTTALTAFTESDGVWERSDAALTQRAYPEDDVLAALAEAGFADVEARDARADLGWTQAGRTFFVATRPDE